MTLTHEDVQLLTQRFAAKEHEFYDGLAYVDEVAVSTRLDSVDPSWHFERIGEPVRTEEQCIVWVRLTVKGVSRDGVGMSKIWLKKKDGAIILNGEPEKSAATDALRRASRLFGIGRYLLQLPADVRDYNALAKWLGESAPQQSKPATPKATNGAPAVAKLTPEQWAHLKSEYGSDLVRAGLKVEKGSDWQGTYEQAVNAILAVNVPF